MKRFYKIILLLFFLLVTGSQPLFPQTCPQGMISYWKLDEFGVVNTFLDSYGGHSGSTTDSTRPVQDSGVVNQSRKFDGTSEITVPENKDFDWGAHTNFSIEVWVKTTSPGTGTKVFIGKRKGGTTQMTWWLGYKDNNKASFFVRDSGGIFSEADGIKLINDGKWHHIVGVRDDSLKVIQLFVDGIEEAKTTTFFTGDFTGTKPIYIGHYEGSYRFIGSLDEVAIYHTKLNAAQISQHYNAGKQRKGYCDKFTTDVEDANIIPGNFKLFQNYPNPFNPVTVIKYQLPLNAYVTLEIYDVLGRKLETLVDERQTEGIHSILFNSGSLVSGVYFYRINADEFSSTKKLILMK